MMERAGTASSKRRLLLALLVLVTAIALYNALFSYSYSFDPNYRNVSVDTKVNITNARPEIMAVQLPSSVTLNAGTTKLVYCNLTIRDWNGYDDIENVTAVFYHSTSTAGAADNNNTHYTNNSCTNVSSTGNYANWTCGFFVLYHALNGTWTCNATVTDNSSATDNTPDNTTTIDALLALNISTPSLYTIDYGDLAVGDTSENKTAIVKNIGNQNINISVKGYGAVDNDGLALNCTVGNISVDNERFSTDPAVDWLTKTALTSDFQTIDGLTVEKQTDPGAPPQNTTYWQLYVPPNPYGQCNGTIVFQAATAT